MKKYFLIGIPGCGKSTLGQKIAEVLQVPFFDTDLLALERMDLDHPFQLFMPSVALQYRNEQIEAIKELHKLDGSAIIATGAEVALMPECAKLMKEMGVIIHIKRQAENVLAEMRNSDKKPMVLRNETDGTEIIMQEESVRLYAEELIHYEILADLCMDNNGNEEEGVEKLADLINSQA